MMYNMNDYVIRLDKLGKIIIYLRKSREDVIDGRYMSTEETLARHEEQLQNWALANLGHKIPEDHIYREVESGEKIKDRPVFQEVLKKLETNSDIDGVLSINCSRLSRGNLVDCGNLMDILEHTNTLVLTPTKIYNLKNKHDKRFFKDELLRGNDFLETVKELLHNGRHFSASIGKFVHSVAPFGYDRVSLKKLKLLDEKGFTLRPNANAEYARLIFDLYLDGVGPFQIASKLNDMNAPLIDDRKWDNCKVKQILRNVTYKGYLTWQKRIKKDKIVNGEVVSFRDKNDNYPIYKGLHYDYAIVTEEEFELVQIKLADNSVPITRGNEVKNPLAGFVKCAVCGKAMIRHSYETFTKRKRKYELDKSELQEFMNFHKKKLKLSNLEIGRRLQIKKHHANEWFGNNPKKFYPSDEFVSNWLKIKELLQITDDKYDDPITVFVDVPKKSKLVCSGHRCSNVSCNLELAEDILLNKIKEKFNDYNFYLDNYSAEIIKKANDSKTTIENIDKKIELKEKQLKKAKIAYETEVDTLEEYVERKKELNDEIKDLIKQKSKHENMKEEDNTTIIKKAVPILQNVLNDYYDLTAAERNELLKTIIESAIYNKKEKNGNIELEVCWLV